MCDKYERGVQNDNNGRYTNGSEVCGANADY